MSAFGSSLPTLLHRPPGPASRRLAERLRAVESRNVTFTDATFPVFWREAYGANVRDVDGNVYIDLTGAFGVALTGHSNDHVRNRLVEQAGRLTHGMGDVHPPAVKVELLERLAACAPWPTTRTILASSGSEAVEAALKTAQLATGRPGILAFEGAYHGLTLGSLAVTSRRHFRGPFEARLHSGVHFAPFPSERPGEPDAPLVLAEVERVLMHGSGNHPIGAVLIEPIQARAGVRIPPQGFMEGLARLARAAGALLIVDEIFTGFGRTGRLFAFQHEDIIPDLICVGKCLGGGMPISGCMGDSTIMDRWPPSSGEAIHTSTFLGHPLSVAAAIAFLDELEQREIVPRAQRAGRRLLAGLQRALLRTPGVADVRGRGLLAAIELDPHRAGSAREPSGAVVTGHCLRNGLLVLPSGAAGNVLQLSPPATLTDEQTDRAIELLEIAVGSWVAGDSPDGH